MNVLSAGPEGKECKIQKPASVMAMEVCLFVHITWVTCAIVQAPIRNDKYPLKCKQNRFQMMILHMSGAGVTFGGGFGNTSKSRQHL